MDTDSEPRVMRFSDYNTSSDRKQKGGVEGDISDGLKKVAD